VLRRGGGCVGAGGGIGGCVHVARKIMVSAASKVLGDLTLGGSAGIDASFLTIRSRSRWRRGVVILAGGAILQTTGSELDLEWRRRLGPV